MRLAPAFPLQPGLLPLGQRSLCGAAAYDDARALLRGSGDCSFVFAFNCRIRDLEDIEDSHGDVIHEMRQCGGHANKSHLPFFSELYERVEGAVLYKGLRDGEAWNCTTSRYRSSFASGFVQPPPR